MKSSICVILALIVPICAHSQGRLFFHATVSMPVAVHSDLSDYYSHGSGGVSHDTMLAAFDDTLSLVAGDNYDSTVIHFKQGTFAPYGFLGYYAFHFDPQSHELQNVRIRGWRWPEDTLLISLDSLPLNALSDSTWTITEGRWACTYAFSYVDRYLMPNGYNGEDDASGHGQSALVTPDAPSGVPMRTESSSDLRITNLGGGTIQVERGLKYSKEAVEIFDALGRVISRATFEGNATRIQNLAPGFYFARLGSEVTKFAVMP